MSYIPISAHLLRLHRVAMALTRFHLQHMQSKARLLSLSRY
jgi:hypothetical protein